MAKILLIEDDKNLQDINKELLEEQGHTVFIAMRLSEAREKFAAEIPDLIVLDVMLPDGTGFDYLAEIRQTSRVPVIMLTAMGEMENLEQGYNTGADDYMTKPYKRQELAWKVKALLKRTEQTPETIKRGLLTLKPTSSEAFVDGVDLSLTPNDFNLLQFFVDHEDRAMNAEVVYKCVWGQLMNNDNRAIKVAISRLRTKLEGSGYTILFNKDKNCYCFEKQK